MVNARNSKGLSVARELVTLSVIDILVPTRKFQEESATVIQDTSQLWLTGQRWNPDPQATESIVS